MSINRPRPLCHSRAARRCAEKMPAVRRCTLIFSVLLYSDCLKVHSCDPCSGFPDPDLPHLPRSLNQLCLGSGLSVGPKMLDHEGKEVPGNRGYKYFGAAKDLPGVRELFEKEPLPPPRKTRAELMKAIDFEYYGYLDEDDGVIVPLEQEYEKRHRAELVEKWKAEREARLARGEEEEGEEEEEVNIYAVAEEESDEEGGPDRGGEDGQQKFIAHVPVPSQQEIEEALVHRKKMELLQKYTSETLQAQSEEARRLLGC
ncbi:pre-mRNA-splicing factor ISY1 homolog isoform X3 [Bubalus kerabau]|uniref:pre-mRNA-splicing factor ISY1 homolog isoform X3 n=1 Tax=Bubalus carabanensis TaxID=3119969 RepID=UPI00244EE103|nr:pre-mRNA-splicing factor ISY1 homolog isoform X3 [Bubalus carabanensis]